MQVVSEGVSETYRVGRHQPQNLYRGEQYIGVMFSPEDAALIVEALNVMQESLEPEHFRDGEGDWWHRQADGRYRMDDWDVPYSLAEIKSRYGTYRVGEGVQPERFRDGDGDWWQWYGDDDYRLDENGTPWTLAGVKKAFGTYYEDSE